MSYSFWKHQRKHLIAYRKIGGMHWLFIGRLRFAWCIKHKQTAHTLPDTRAFELALESQRAVNALHKSKLRTYVPDEHNHFIF